MKSKTEIKLTPNTIGTDSPILENSEANATANVDIWGEARAAYSIYAALAKQFSLGELPHPQGELPPAKPTREIFESDLRWLDKIDANIKAFQIRQLPPSTLNGNEEALRAFIHRQLRKPEKSSTDRDKIDFLIVQYFALCAPDTMYREEITLDDVARVLQPVIARNDSGSPDWCLPLEAMLDSVKECRSLRDLLERGVLEQGRMLKESSGELFYYPAALVTFARFNFLVRRAFIRLLHSDQDAVVKAIDELERAGVRSVDCRRAGYSAAESVANLRLIAQNWRPLYQKDYSANEVTRSFEQLLSLRADLEDALAKLNGEASEPARAPQNDEETTELNVAETSPETTVAFEPVPPELAPAQSAEKVSIEPTAVTSTPSNARADVSSKPIELMDAHEPSPGATQPHLNAAGDPAAPAEPAEILKAISEQLNAAPASHGMSMSTILLKNTKVLLSSWEVVAFVGEGGQDSEDLRRAVVARAVIAVAMDSRKQTGESASLGKAIEMARAEVAYFMERVEQAKKSKNIEAAINLGISTKRLLSFIEESEKLQP
jgi:hypothetical protein